MATTTNDQGVRPFNEWILDHARGSLNDEMTAALAELVLTVTSMEKAKGSVTLKITVEQAGTGDRTVLTSGEVVTKLPRPPAPRSVFYPDDAGGLHRSDPERPSLFTDPKENPQP